MLTSINYTQLQTNKYIILADTTTTTRTDNTTTATLGSDPNCDGTETFTELSVTCSPNGIVVNMPLCAFINVGMSYSESDLADPTAGCQSVLTGSSVEYNFPASNECGTTVNNNGTHLIYSNVISGTTGDIAGIISRRRSMAINFSCALQLGELPIILTFDNY